MTDVTQQAYPQPQPRLPMGAVAGQTLRTFGQAPGAFIALAAIVAIPTLAHVVLTPPEAGFNKGYVITLVARTFVLWFVQIAISDIVVRCMDRQPYNLGAALTLSVRRYVPVAITMVIVTLAYCVGMILLFVPGIIASLMFVVALPACALESLQPVDSLKRSMDLTRDNRWRILGSYMILFAPIMVVIMVVSVVAGIKQAAPMGQRVNEIIEIFWVPFISMFNAVLYFALRRMKGYDGIAKVFD